jgi:hypothetical protein
MEDLFNQIMGYLNSAMGLSATIAMVLEFVLRLIPTQKPASILYMVAGGAKMLGTLFGKLGEFLDKVLPQKLAAPVAPVEPPK